MKLCRPDYYNAFSCLAGVCPDTCCIGWEVVVDDEALAHYAVLQGPLGDKIRSVTEETDGEHNFRLRDGRCPFLKEDLLCEIQCSEGESGLCRTCRRFPRYQADYGALREEGLSISCPEAARLIMTAQTSGSFVVSDAPELTVQPNDIDAELYLSLREVRGVLFELAQDQTISIEERMAHCLLLTARLQKAWREGGDIGVMLADWKKGMYRDDDKSEIERCLARSATAQNVMHRLIGEFRAMERLTDRWGCLLDDMDAAIDDLPKRADDARQAYENLFVYYIYRYFLESVYDGNFYLRVKMAAVSVSVIALLHRTAERDGAADGIRRIDLAHLYSREIEHSQENLDALYDLLKDVNLGGKRALVPFVLA